MPLSPLGFLVHKALLQDRTGIGERGTRISIAPREHETVFLFRTDGNEFGEHFGIDAKQPRCDAVLLYLREAPGAPVTIRLVLLELKGRDHGHAVDQIERVFCAVKERLTPILGRGFFSPHNVRALIVSSTRSPPQLKKKQEDFMSRHRVAVELCRPDEEALRNYLK